MVFLIFSSGISPLWSFLGTLSLQPAWHGSSILFSSCDAIWILISSPSWTGQEFSTLFLLEISTFWPGSSTFCLSLLWPWSWI